MHLEIRDGNNIFCKVDIPKDNRQGVDIDCVLPPAKAFWREDMGMIFVFHPNMKNGPNIMIADPKVNRGIASRDFRARFATDPESEREKTLNIKAIIFD